MGRPLEGYEHSYQFRGEEEIVALYPTQVGTYPKGFLFEFRTKFSLKTRKKNKLVGSERFAVSFHRDADYECLPIGLDFRLKPDYWMSDDEIQSFSRQALDFARQERAKRSFFPVTAVVVELNVCTVQRAGETARSVASRAIRPERLIPIYVWPYVPKGVKFDQSAYLLHKSFFWELPRVRLEDDDQTRGGVCPVCSRGFAVGDQVYNSLVPGGCEHACHSHCVFKSFRKRRFECPSCHVHVPNDVVRMNKRLKQGGEASGFL